MKTLILAFFIIIPLLGFGQNNPKDALIEAVEQGEIEKAKQLIDADLFVLNDFNECSDIPFLFLLRKKNLTTVYHPIGLKTLFHMTCECNDTIGIKYLIDSEADFINERVGLFQVTPILIAAEAGNLWAVQYLIEKEANIFDEDYQGYNLPFYAAKSHNIDLLKMIINLDTFSINQRKWNKLPIHNVMVSGKNAVDVIDFLMKYQELDTVDYYELLFGAVRVNDLNSVKYLFENGYVSDVNRKNNFGKPIYFELGKYIKPKNLSTTIQLLEYLISKGLNVNSLISLGYYNRYKSKEIVYFLIDKGATLYYIHRREVLFLVYLSVEETKEQEDIILTLWEQKLKENSFFTSDPVFYFLHEIIIRERVEILDYWLNHPIVQPKLNFVDDNNQTLLDYAKSTKNRKIIKIVSKYSIINKI